MCGSWKWTSPCVRGSEGKTCEFNGVCVLHVCFGKAKQGHRCDKMKGKQQISLIIIKVSPEEIVISLQHLFRLAYRVSLSCKYGHQQVLFYIAFTRSMVTLVAVLVYFNKIMAGVFQNS